MAMSKPCAYPKQKLIARLVYLICLNWKELSINPSVKVRMK